MNGMGLSVPLSDAQQDQLLEQLQQLHQLPPPQLNARAQAKLATAAAARLVMRRSSTVGYQQPLTLPPVQPRT